MSKKLSEYLSEQLGAMYTGKSVYIDEDGKKEEVEAPKDFVLSDEQKSYLESWISSVKDYEKCSVRVHVLSSRTRRFEAVLAQQVISWIDDREYNEPIISRMATVNDEKVERDIAVRKNIESIRKAKVQEMQKRVLERHKKKYGEKEE